MRRRLSSQAGLLQPRSWRSAGHIQAASRCRSCCLGIGQIPLTLWAAPRTVNKAAWRLAAVSLVLFARAPEKASAGSSNLLGNCPPPKMFGFSETCSHTSASTARTCDALRSSNAKLELTAKPLFRRVVAALYHAVRRGYRRNGQPVPGRILHPPGAPTTHLAPTQLNVADGFHQYLHDFGVPAIDSGPSFTACPGEVVSGDGVVFFIRTHSSSRRLGGRYILASRGEVREWPIRHAGLLHTASQGGSRLLRLRKES